MNRIKELDFTRVIAMLAVITIHVTSTYITNQSSTLILGMNLAFLLNQVTRFAVPLFILVSGVSLGSKRDLGSFGAFLRGRLVKIGTPYAVWSALYLLYQNHSNLSALSVRSVFRTFLLGQAAPHLYFVVIIFQLYLLVPLLKRWVERAPCASLLGSFLISYGIQKLFYFLNYDVDWIPDLIRPHLWMLFPTWIFYFVLGLLLTGPRLTALQKLAYRNSAAILLATFAFAWIYVIESSVTGSLDSIKSPLDLYVPLMLLACFAAWKYLGRVQAVQALTRVLARHSMTIYFGHVLVLYGFRRFPLFYRGMSGMLLLLVAVVVVSCAAAVLIDRLTDRLKTCFRSGVTSSQ